MTRGPHRQSGRIHGETIEPASQRFARISFFALEKQAAAAVGRCIEGNEFVP